MPESDDIRQDRLALGARLAAWRAAAGKSQRSLSTKLAYSRSTVANVEVGRQSAPRDFWQRCDEVLAAGGQLLGAYDQLAARIREHAVAQVRQLHDVAAVQAGSTDAVTAGTVEGAGNPQAITEEIEAVRRSQFLTLAGTAVAGALAPPLVHGWHEHSASNLPPLTEDLLEALGAQVQGFRWRDRQEGSRQLLPPTARFGHDLARFWRLTDAAHPLRRQLGRLAADTCHLVAYQAFDQGDRLGAIEWYRSSAELAAHSKAADLYIFAVCGVAYMHARNGHGDLALSVLHQLSELPRTEAARCYVAVYEAHAHASDGNRDAVAFALDRASAAAEATAHEVPSPWLGVTDASFVDRQRAIVLSQLGDPAALGVLARLDRQTPAVFQRYQITLRTDFALVHAHLGQVEEAALHLTEAVARNRAIQSVEKTSAWSRPAARLRPTRPVRPSLPLMKRSTTPPALRPFALTRSPRGRKAGAEMGRQRLSVCLRHLDDFNVRPLLDPVRHRMTSLVNGRE